MPPTPNRTWHDLRPQRGVRPAARNPGARAHRGRPHLARQRARWWIGAAEYEGLDAELLEYGHHTHDDTDHTHCGTVEIHGLYWDVYVRHTGETTTTRTRWDTLVDTDGKPRYLPQGPETIELTAPYVTADPQQHEPLGEDIRLAVAAAAEPRLLTPADGYLVERCVRAALAAADTRPSP